MSTPTDQQILDGLRTALYEIAVNGAQSYVSNGRTWTGLDIDKLNKAIAIYEAKVLRPTRRMFAPASFRGSQ